MNRSLRKELLREIRRSRNRFLSILVMVGLGVMFLVGLRSAAPDMRRTADAFFDDSGLYDLQLVSTLGLTQRDLDAVSRLEGAEICEGAVTLDAVMGLDGAQKTVKLHSLQKELNRPVLREGRMPAAPDECLADPRLKSSANLNIGDRITLDTPEAGRLAGREFTVTGFADSPLYLSIDRGTSSLGDGSVAGFLLLPEGSFSAGYFTQICIAVRGAAAEDAYGQDYRDLVGAVSRRAEPLLQTLAAERYETLRADGAAALRDGEADLKAAESDAARQLQAGETSLDRADCALREGRRALDAARAEYEAALAAGEEKLAAGRSALEEGRVQLRQAAAQLNAGRMALSVSEAMLDRRVAAAEAEIPAAEREAAACRAAVGPAQAEAAAAEDAAAAYLEALNRQLLSPAAGDGSYTWEGYAEMLRQAALARARAAAAESTLRQAEKRLAEQRAAPERIRREGEQELAEARQELTAGQAEYNAGLARVSAAAAELKAGEEALEEQRSAGAAALEAAEEELRQKTEEYRDGLRTYGRTAAETRKKLLQGREDLKAAGERLRDLAPAKCYVLDRNTNYGFVSYDQNAQRMANLAKLFPVIFFLVAALVCLTTMTRMVEEERTQIGAVKALGYGTMAIAGKYLTYGVSAALLGALLGAAAGTVVIPKIIFSSYAIMYVLPKLELRVYWGLCLIAAGAGVLCTVGATLWAVLATARQTPAALMRPKAPKPGKRILLERVGFLWTRMTFSMKVSARNLFRYKKRLWMTVIGVAGCTGLLIAGLGLHSSIFDILDVQFFDLYQYDIQLTLDPDSEGTEQRLEQILSDGSAADRAAVYSRSVSFLCGGKSVDGYVNVTEDPDALARMVRLRDMDDKSPMQVPEDGILIDVKLAELLGVQPGDRITVDAGERIEFTVSGIREHYVYHYALMTADVWEQATGGRPQPNEILIRAADSGDEAVSSLCERLMAVEGVRSASNKGSMARSFRKTMEVVDAAVMVIVLSAAALAFVVLYNLTNINVTERTRELATIKVLGFYDPEVAMYVYRENAVLTLMGIALGQLFGKYLCTFLIRTIEMDIVMFGRDAKLQNYLLSVLLSVVFALIVNFFMYFRMKKIDMVESLKSVE